MVLRRKENLRMQVYTTLSNSFAAEEAKKLGSSLGWHSLARLFVGFAFL
jgi:hypothetical protein